MRVKPNKSKSTEKDKVKREQNQPHKGLLCISCWEHKPSKRNCK